MDTIIRENIPSITWAYRLRDIKPDHSHTVKQGILNIWRVASVWVGELVIGEQDENAKLKPGAIMLTNEFAYRNTSSPQDIADDIYACNHGDDTVRQLSVMPSQAAAALGSIKSERKTAAARENAKKGGWPKGKARKPKDAR